MELVCFLLLYDKQFTLICILQLTARHNLSFYFYFLAVVGWQAGQLASPVDILWILPPYAEDSFR